MKPFVFKLATDFTDYTEKQIEICENPCNLWLKFLKCVTHIDISPDTYKQLKEQSRRAGKAPEVFGRELLETALQTHQEVQPRTTRDVLKALGRVRPLSETLRSKIISGVTLTETRTILVQASGPTLSEIIREQRGPNYD